MEEYESEAKKVFAKVATLENEFEAEIIKDALEKEKIPTMIRSFRDTAYDGIYILQKGWGNVLVPEEFREEAEKIVNAIKRSFDKTPENAPDNTIIDE